MLTIDAVIIDLDGTVVDEAKRISPATLRAAADLAYRRIPLIIATARSPIWVAQFQALMPTVKLAVCCGGAVGWSPAEHSLLWRDTIAPATVKDIALEVVTAFPMTGIAVFDGETWLVTKRFAQVGPPRRGTTEVVEATQLHDHAVCAMTICHPPEIRHALRTLLVELDSSLMLAVKRPAVTDIAPAGTNKGRGVLHALNVVGVDPAHAIAFGDTHIDLPMFAVCGHSVAVANAHSDVIAAAMYLAACVHADGFARMLGQLGLTAPLPDMTPECTCAMPRGEPR